MKLLQVLIFSIIFSFIPSNSSSMIICYGSSLASSSCFGVNNGDCADLDNCCGFDDCGCNCYGHVVSIDNSTLVAVEREGGYNVVDKIAGGVLATFNLENHCVEEGDAFQMRYNLGSNSITINSYDLTLLELTKGNKERAFLMECEIQL